MLNVEDLKRNMDICLTINSNLAITISVTGLEESLGLSVSQSSGSGREVLQEQPVGGQSERNAERL